MAVDHTLGAPPVAGTAVRRPTPRGLTEFWSTRDPRHWPELPPGDGRPLLLIPGFLAGDASLRRMASWLRAGGFQPEPSRIRSNVSCMEAAVGRLEARLERAVDRSGRPAIIVGQSRGGVFGRVLTVRRPDLVEQLITLGSPVCDQLAVHPRQWLTIGTVGLMGTVGVPGMFTIRCVRGACCARSRAELAAALPAGPRFTSVYSRRDEIIRWQSCLDPAAEHVEVNSAHVGMGFSADVWRVIAGRLGARPRPGARAAATLV